MRKRFAVEKDNGEQWWMLFTAKGVSWERRSDKTTSRKPDPSIGPPSDAATASPGSAMNILQAAANPIGAVAAVIEAVSDVLSWWESRQYRLMDQARFEEERRIPWTADMMARWVRAHEGGGHLDLRITSFLAREATATMNALVNDKRMAVPQALLYDLELVREVLSATRRLYADQFHILSADDQSDVSKALRGALPNSRLNLQFIDRLAEDPSIEWSRRVRDRASRAFDEDLRDATRHYDLFMNTLFKSTKADRTGVDEMDEGLLNRVFRRVSIVPSLPGIVSEQLRGDATSRRDDYRELALFASEADRVNALHAAWGIVDTTVRDQAGGSILVSELAGSTSLSLPPAPSRASNHRAIES